MITLSQVNRDKAKNRFITDGLYSFFNLIPNNDSSHDIYTPIDDDNPYFFMKMTQYRLVSNSNRKNTFMVGIQDVNIHNTILFDDYCHNDDFVEYSKGCFECDKTSGFTRVYVYNDEEGYIGKYCPQCAGEILSVEAMNFTKDYMSKVIQYIEWVNSVHDKKTLNSRTLKYIPVDKVILHSLEVKRLYPDLATYRLYAEVKDNITNHAKGISHRDSRYDPYNSDNMEMLKKIKGWVENSESTNDYFSSLKKALEKEYVEEGNMNLVSSSVKAYESHLYMLEMRAEEKEIGQKIGSPKDLVSFEVVSVTTPHVYHHQRWGTSKVYRMEDVDGNFFEWKTSTNPDFSALDNGEKITVKGKIKEHVHIMDYDNNTRTNINRVNYCKLL